MSDERVQPVTAIDWAQWAPGDEHLAFHYVNFARMANAVVTEPGPLQGWFEEALWRHYSYAPFNGRVMENYFSLAFFYGYDAPWNRYYRDPAVLRRLELALDYTFGLMGENGAIPEYAPVEMDAPMLAPSSFGMEYMAAALEVAGPLLPAALRERLTEHARRAAVYVLTSDEAWTHARRFTNQFLGAMAGAARLARATGDDALLALVNRAGPSLLEEGNFMAPMGFLYENDGPETFSYFFVTLKRLIPMAHEWGDPCVAEVLRRHCAWMSRWMLPEPDGETVLLAGAHQTRTGGGFRIERETLNGIGALLDGQPAGGDERRVISLFLPTRDEVEAKRRALESEEDPPARLLAEGRRRGYPPVSTRYLYPPYAPTREEQRQAVAALPCHDGAQRCEVQEDDRGNQYVFVRFPRYYLGAGFATRGTMACHGPNFLWLPDAGAVVLGENGSGPCWETQVGEGSTGKGTGLARAREGRGGYELLLTYPELKARKTFVLRPDEIDVQVVARGHQETIPLLLREADVLHADYGRCLAGGLGNRGMGLVTRTLAIERAGRRICTLDFGAPVKARIKSQCDPDGMVRATLVFSPAEIYYFTTGYKILLA